MIKAIIFDCFGVLYWDDLNRLYNLAPPERFTELNDVIHACDHGYIGKQDFLNQVAALASISVDAVVAVMHDKQSRNEPLIKRVSELKPSYKTALLSNMGVDTLDGVFSEQERTALFDHVIISSEVGVIKPSRDIFEITLERLGVTADEALFVDDRPANTDGANRIGMQTILFTTNAQFEIELATIMDRVSA